MKNANAAIIVALLLTVGMLGHALIGRQTAVVVPEPTPVVVPSWQGDLTRVLAAEKKPQRVTQLRNLWAGFAELIPVEAQTVLAIQRANQFAGKMTVDGLGPRNEHANKIIADQLKITLAKIDDPLDATERETIRSFFADLATAAGDAL